MGSFKFSRYLPTFAAAIILVTTLFFAAINVCQASDRPSHPSFGTSARCQSNSAAALVTHNLVGGLDLNSSDLKSGPVQVTSANQPLCSWNGGYCNNERDCCNGMCDTQMHECRPAGR